jgi:hypothetical protein
MGTDNPKVSAYVPQVLKDRLKVFREERDGISESQAVTIILAEYFQMPEVLGRSLSGSSVGGVTLARMEALEEKLAALVVSPSSLPSGLLEKIDQLSVLVESLEKRIETLEHGGLLSRPKSELQEADLVAAAKEIEEVISQGELPLEVDALPTNESIDNKQLELIESTSSNLLSEPLQGISPIPDTKLSELRLGEIRPIPGTKLSELRFGRAKDTLAGVKKKMSPERFIEWTREHDPDKIAWKQVENPAKGYVPADELPSELKSSLLRWIKENLR